MPAGAIPLIAGGASLGSGILSYMGAKKASKPGPDEAAATRTQTGASQALSQQGGMLTSYGQPKLQQAGNYFTSLASGNRAQTAQTLQPEVSNINDVYGGTQRTLQRFLRGPERDQQMGDLSRQRAGAIGGLFAGARQRGVEGLVDLGKYGTSAGASAYSGAAGISGDVAERSMRNRYGGAELQRQAGGDTASLIFQLLKSGAFKWGAGAGGGGGEGAGGSMGSNFGG